MRAGKPCTQGAVGSAPMGRQGSAPFRSRRGPILRLTISLARPSNPVYESQSKVMPWNQLVPDTARVRGERWMSALYVSESGLEFAWDRPKADELTVMASQSCMSPIVLQVWSLPSTRQLPLGEPKGPKGSQGKDDNRG